MSETYFVWDPYLKQPVFWSDYEDDCVNYKADSDPQNEGGLHVRQATEREASLYAEGGVLDDPILRRAVGILSDRTGVDYMNVAVRLDDWAGVSGMESVWAHFVGPMLDSMQGALWAGDEKRHVECGGCGRLNDIGDDVCLCDMERFKKERPAEYADMVRDGIITES